MLPLEELKYGFPSCRDNLSGSFPGLACIFGIVNPKDIYSSYYARQQQLEENIC